MANKKISELTQIGIANLTDTDQLVVVDVESSATRRLSVNNLKSHITTTSGNLHHFASYANATFLTAATIGDVDAVQSNLRQLGTTANASIDLVQGNVDSFATYANATFATGSQSAASDNVQSNLHTFASFSNTTFATITGLTGANASIDTVEGNLTTFATYANTTFGGDMRPLQG